MRIALLVAATALFAATAAQAQDRRVLVHNETGHTITHFYASNTGTNSWEEDILGVDVLPSGEAAMINIDDGTGACDFDFKAVFDDGEEAIKGGVNVCEISDFYFTE